MVYTKTLFKFPKIKSAKKEEKGEALITLTFEEEIENETTEKIIRELKRENFKGKQGQISYQKKDGEEIIVVGIGKREKAKNENIKRGIGAGMVKARDLGFKKVKVSLPENMKNFEWVEDIVEGGLLALYRFEKYKKDEDKKEIEEILIEGGIDEKIKSAEIIAEAVNFARDIINEPGNVINPNTLAEIASRVAEEYDLGCEIFDFEEIKRMGMGGVIAVGQGSAIPPKFVHMWWKPKNPKDVVAYIGKAITFDSGGLSLKPPSSMVTMKADKSGACAVLAAMKVIGKIKPEVEVHGIFAACENMPSDKAQRPDDIIKISNGMTVEVLNTDAEGRLTLVDAINFAAKFSPSKIIDLATLTGACIVALGEYTAGLMGEPIEFLEELQKIANEVGDKCWILPLDEDLEPKLKSEFADVKNVSDGPGAGAITAALFMKKFLPKGIKWAHFDIAGPAFIQNPVGYYTVKGGTGYGVRTLIKYVRNLSK